ncbi:MAG: methanogenesis marker 8 protein [Candidatus Helarchaeota archaeon]
MGIKDEHIWEVAKARVIVRNRRVILVENDPLVKYCPLHEFMGGTKFHTKETVKKHLERKIKYIFHLCSPNRTLSVKFDGVGYGASETFSSGIKEGLIDCVVEPCDGAGTILTNDPDVVQGIGIAMNALISTTPIPEIISRLKELGVTIVDPKSATLDQYTGVKKAFELGYKNVGVTIDGPNAKTITEIRKLQKDYNAKAIVCGMHTTGITEDLIPFIIKFDLAHGCGSKVMRNLVSKKARKTYGKNIPVYAFSEEGQKLLDLREKITKKNPPMIIIGDIKIPNPLI